MSLQNILKTTDVKDGEFKLYINDKGSHIVVSGKVWFDIDQICYCAQVNERDIQASDDCDHAILKALTDAIKNSVNEFLMA